MSGIYVTDSGSNGTSWYRRYSNGWVEQGGAASGYGITVSLWVKMRDTNYTVISGKVFSGESGSSAAANIYSKTQTSFVLNGWGQGGGSYSESVPINYTVYGWGG